MANNAAFRCHVNYTSILMKPLLTVSVLSLLCLCQDFGLVYANNTYLDVNPEQVLDISERAFFCKCTFHLRSMTYQGSFKLLDVHFFPPIQDRCNFIFLHILKVRLSFFSKCYYNSLCTQTLTRSFTIIYGPPSSQNQTYQEKAMVLWWEMETSSFQICKKPMVQIAEQVHPEFCYSKQEIVPVLWTFIWNLNVIARSITLLIKVEKHHY